MYHHTVFIGLPIFLNVALFLYSRCRRCILLQFFVHISLFQYGKCAFFHAILNVFLQSNGWLSCCWLYYVNVKCFFFFLYTSVLLLLLFLSVGWLFTLINTHADIFFCRAFFLFSLFKSRRNAINDIFMLQYYMYV